MDFTWINLGVVALVIYGTSLHELGHAYVATWLGDRTPARFGRLTMNPVPHLQPMLTAIVIPLVMYMSGNGLLCLAQTPIDPTRFRRPFIDHALVAVAGPVMNLLLMSVMIAILWIPNVWNLDNFITLVLIQASMWNFILAGFNLMPIPPLDGYWICRGLIPLRFRMQTDALARSNISMIIVLLAGSTIFKFILPVIGPVWEYLLPQRLGIFR